MKTLEEVWQSFNKILPADAPAVQRREMKMAFYAGAAGVMARMGLVSTEAVSEDEGVEILEGANREIQEYTRRLVEGKEG
jgi:hypothetical protein